MNRSNQRQGFLVSAVIHLTLLMMALTVQPRMKDPSELSPSELESRQVVFMPPPAVMQQLAPAPPPAAVPRPAATPTPPPTDPTRKDRISIGPESEVRRTDRMTLRPDDDLTKVARGDPKATPQAVEPTPDPAAATPAEARRAAETREVKGREGLRLPQGLMGPPAPSEGEEGSRGHPGSLTSSVREAVDDVTRRVARQSPFGDPRGTGKSVQGLRYDPHGADFTLWVSHLTAELYRNWFPPQAAYFYSGHVDFRCVVERDGRISSIRMLKTSGTTSLDKAARNALQFSRMMALPDDYGPAQFEFEITFSYNEAPQGS